MNRRSLRQLVVEIMIPFALVFAGFHLSKLSFYFDSPSKLISPEVFGQSQRVVIN